MLFVEKQTICNESAERLARKETPVRLAEAVWHRHQEKKGPHTGQSLVLARKRPPAR